jgi:hypothetical protein
MKNGDTEHDLDSIADLLHQQTAILEVLVRHLADTKATLVALASKTLSNEDFRIVEKLRGDNWVKFYKEMIREVERYYLQE